MTLGAVSAENKKAGKEVAVKCIAGLKYDVTEIQAKAGEPLTIKFSNPDIMPHNFVIVKAGTEQKVAQAAMALGADGMKKGYIPESEDVIAHSKLLNKGQAEDVTVKFDKAGEYPFICTFPGHSVIMKGKIIVK